MAGAFVNPIIGDWTNYLFKFRDTLLPPDKDAENINKQVEVAEDTLKSIQQTKVCQRYRPKGHKGSVKQIVSTIQTTRN